LVRLLFGQKWLAIVPALIILPLIVPVRMVCNILYTTSLALGNRALELRNTIINFVLLPTGFYVGAHWGLIGLCAAWLVTIPLAYSFTVVSVVRFIGVRISGVLAECAAPAAAAVIMYAAIAALRLVTSDWPNAVALVSLIVAGGLVYFGALALVSRRHLVSAFNFSRTMLGG
jgi:PST family polysaccharide transporter